MPINGHSMDTTGYEFQLLKTDLIVMLLTRLLSCNVHLRLRIRPAWNNNSNWADITIILHIFNSLSKIFPDIETIMEL